MLPESCVKALQIPKHRGGTRSSVYETPSEPWLRGWSILYGAADHPRLRRYAHASHWPARWVRQGGCLRTELCHQPDVRAGRIKRACPASPHVPINSCNTTSFLSQQASVVSKGPLHAETLPQVIGVYCRPWRYLGVSPVASAHLVH